MTKRVKRDFPTESWDEFYRRYQMTLADDYLIPILSGWNVQLDGRKFLEVGCGDGGCGAAFARKGCKMVMMDIEDRLVGIAEDFNKRENIDARTFVGDVFDVNAPFYEEGPFDVVMLRDVMEHLENPVKALETILRFLSNDGVVFVVFPPYYSPFGAHQQILPRKQFAYLPYNRLPYLQLLPAKMFLSLIRAESSASEEVERLNGIRLTIGKFERAVYDAGFIVRRKKLFLSRPTFALRYGIPVIDASVLGTVPYLKEVLVTGAYYLLEPDANR